MSSLSIIPNCLPDPIIIRGTGPITLFGLNNRFNTDMPPILAKKVAPEEYRQTVEKINDILNAKLSHNIAWLIYGCCCFCCTCGWSLYPAIYLKKQIKRQLKRFLDDENENLYNKLGLNWKLAKQELDGGGASSLLTEYVLLIDYIQKYQIYSPD